MYSTREAMAYSGKLPEQQQSGITPDLINLLAMQKVEDDKKAAAIKMALAAGQPMPTVAESLKQKALESAKQEIAQKLGLPALAQQQAPQGQAAIPPQAQASQAAPQQAPQQPPQQPPQQAPQGVAAVQSNLPKAYSHGGILSFAGEDESQVPDPAAQYRSIIESNGSEEEKQAALARLLQAQAAGNAGPHNPTPATMAMRRQQAPQRPQEVDRYALTPEMLALQNKAMSRLMEGMNADPEKNSEVAEERFKAATGKSFAEAIEAKKEGLAAIKALQEKDQAGRPSQFWRTISAIGAKGPNVQPGQWGAGVAEKVQGQNEAYNATDIARQKALNDLNDTIHTAIANNDLNIYNAGKAEWVRTMGQLGTSTHDAVTMADSQLKTLESARATHEVAMGRLQGRSQFAAQQKDIQEARLEEIKARHGIQAVNEAHQRIADLDKVMEKKEQSIIYGPSGDAQRAALRSEYENKIATIYRDYGLPYKSTVSPDAAKLAPPPPGTIITKTK